MSSSLKLSQPESDTLTKSLAAYIIALPSLMLFARGLADVVVALTGFAFLWRSYRVRDWIWTREPWFLAVLVLIGYLLVFSAPFAFDGSKAALYTLGFLRWPLFAMALSIWIFRDPRTLNWFGLSALGVIVFIVLDCLWQFHFGTDIFGFEKFDNFRLTGPLRDNPIPGTLTLRLFFVALFSFACVLYTFGSRHVVDGVCLLLAGYCFFQFATGERMSFLLFITGAVLVVAGLWLQFPPHRRRLIGWFALSCGGLVLAALIEPQLYERSVLSMIEALASFGTHDYARVFSSGYEIWKMNFFTGVGLGNYAEYCDAQLVHEACQQHPHNIYLHWLAVSGLPGALLFIAMLALLFRRIFPPISASKNWFLLCCGIATVFVTFWPIASSSSFFNNWFGAVIWCGIGWLLAVARSGKQKGIQDFFFTEGNELVPCDVNPAPGYIQGYGESRRV